MIPSSAASAIAANTFCRSMVAASFPLFSRQMFENMGIQWAATLLGCLAICLVPIPVGFYFFGKKLRSKSKFAPFFEPASESAAVEMDDEVTETEGDERA